MNAILKNKKVRTWSIAAAVVVVVILVGLRFSSANAVNTAVDMETKVVALDVAETIEASGSLEAQPFASLDWKTSGIVETVNVKTGDFVKAGDILLTLQPSSTSASIVAAQADLVTAQKNLENLTSPDGSSVGAARENTSGAFDTWNNARTNLMDKVSYNKGGGNDELYNDLVTVRDDLSNALEDYPLAANTDAQFYYWAARADSLGYIGDYDYAALKKSLRAKLDASDAELVDEILKTQSEFESLAQSFTESMEDQDDAIDLMQVFGAYEQTSDALLDTLQSEYGVLVEPSISDLTSAQAKVDSAQASVNSLSIIAPFDGEVLSVNQHVGDLVNSSELSVNMADMDHLYIETQVDESDIANVKLGNQAQVTLDALTGVTLTGKVTAINPVGEVVSGLVKYTVRVDLDKVKEDIFLPLGTTANVVIQTKSATATLAVAIAAIQNDSKGEYVWVTQSDGSAKRVDIISGVIVGNVVTISGDLKEGDQVQLIHKNSFEAPNPFGGGKQK